MATQVVTHSDETSDREGAFRDVFEKQQPALTRLAFAICGNWSSAEECVADAIGRTWVRWDSGHVENLDTYVRRAVVNTAVGLVRRRGRRRRLRAPGENLAQGPEDAVAGGDWARRAVLRLPPKHREVVVLRYLDDRSDREIAALLGVPEGTVKSRLSRALEALRREMAGDVEL